MIYVVCGTQKFPLNRLLKALDELVENGKIKERIVAQIGHSDYYPKHYEWVKFNDSAEFEKNIRECSLLLTHSGVGTILAGKENNKPILVFPRSKKYGEHVDDHQWQIARMFAEKNYVLICESVEELEEKIELCKSFSFRELIPKENVLVDVISEYLKENL